MFFSKKHITVKDGKIQVFRYGSIWVLLNKTLCGDGSYRHKAS
ncbi:MAG: hypothetical protein RHS_5270 [Robinsoniella sp. RHS]|nr:MAG: hypothetical protein RHS_5270 [Robinsoniella sp. RHS]